MAGMSAEADHEIGVVLSHMTGHAPNDIPDRLFIPIRDGFPCIGRSAIAKPVQHQVTIGVLMVLPRTFRALAD